MISAYPACFYHDKGGGYSVIFPDLNTATCGDTLDDAFDMAMDCLAAYIDYLRSKHLEIPAPSSLPTVKLDSDCKDYGEAFVSLVFVNVDEYAKHHFGNYVKRTVSIPKEINKMVIEKDIDLSETLSNALRQKLILTEPEK